MSWLDYHSIIALLRISILLLRWRRLLIWFSILFLFKFLPEYLFFLLVFFKLFSLLSVLVKFNDSDNSEQLDDSHSPCGCSTCFGLSGKTRYWRSSSCGEDEIGDEIYIEDYGNGGDNIEKKKEREKIVLDNPRTKYNLDSENAHHY